MRIDGMQLTEGSTISNLSVATGTSFPSSPNSGELFFRTDGLNVGLYVNDGSTWNKCFTEADPVTLPANTTPGTYKSVAVNSQGIVTAGTNPTTLAGYGIADAQALDADLTAIAALAGTSGLLKKTAADTWTLDTNTYITGNQTITLTGGVTGSGTGSITATVVTNANLTGVVTSTGNATSIANGAITNAMLANSAVANLSGTNTGDQTNITGNAATVTTNANLTGPITSTGNATAVASQTGTGSTFVMSAGPTLTGTLSTASITASGLVTANAGMSVPTGQVLSIADQPATGTSAANKNYVDSIAAGLTWKNSVKAATTTAITLSAPQTADGVSLIAGDRVLVKNQASAATNGIYVVAAGAWGRATDMDSSTPINEFNGAGVLVVGGSTQANTSWTVSSSITTVGTDAVNWAQFSGASVVAAGAGITLTGNTVSLTNSTAVGNLSGTNTGDQTITLTGDVTGSGTGSFAATLATVNSNVGSFGSSSNIPVLTVNAKGQVTAISNTAVSIPSGSISVTGGDLTLSGNTGTAITNATLATVTQGAVGTSFVKVALDTKGRVTNNLAVAQADITGLLGAGSITNTMLANGAVANLSGTNTGDQTSVTGNAGTATALQTARTIAGTSFDGTANIGITYSNLTGLPTLGTAAAKNIPATGDASATEVVYGTDTRLTNARAANGGNAATVTNGVYTTDTGTVTNTMLAGSIANAKLLNSSVTVGSTNIALGATSTTLAGLSSVTSTSFVGALTGNASTVTNGIYTTDTGTVTNTMLAGSIANAKLTNSSVTIGSTAVSLGSTVTTFAGLTSVTSSSFVGALTGNASTVTTNANLTGEVTSVGNAATLTNSAVIGKVLTGYVSGAGTVAATDTILQAIQKLNGNIGAAPGTVTSVSVASANGFAGSVATATSTPAITISTSVTGLLKGNGTAVSAAVQADVTGLLGTGSITNTMLVNNSLTVGSTNIALGATSTTLAGLTSVTSTSFVGALTGNASTVTTNANLTGPITSVGNATSIASQTGTGTTFVMSAGPTLTGTTSTAALTSSGLITANAGITVPTGQVITIIDQPSAGTSAANKNYVDAVAAGLAWKNSVKAATTGAITLSAPQTIDGVSVIAGDRVLVKNQASAPTNGIYVVAAGAWTRATDMDSSTPINEFNGAGVHVVGGTTLGNTSWTVSSTIVTVGTDAVNWAQFSGASVVAAGTGITLSGNTISLTNSSLTVGSTSIALGATATTLAGLTSVTSTTFVGALTGNASTATSATSATTATHIAGGLAGNIHYQSGVGATALLTTGTSSQVLVSGATPAWTNTPTLTGTNFTGIPNGGLTNSSLTVGSTNIALGATSTTLAGLTSVTSTSFVGALTGNASTATTLATARNINGVSFNGSADITVTSAAGTLTGATLNSGVTASSLTSVGTLTALNVNATATVTGVTIDSLGNVDTASLTTSATTPNQVVDTVATATYRSVKYIISVTSSTSYHYTEVNIIHDGTTAFINETNTMFTGASLATFDAAISVGNLTLTVTPTNAVTTIKAMRLAIAV